MWERVEILRILNGTGRCLKRRRGHGHEGASLANAVLVRMESANIMGSLAFQPAGLSRASVPSGASTGKYGDFKLKDGGAMGI